MRTFIGVDFTDDIKQRLAEIQNIIRANSRRGRFKYVGNFHLTLKFLGETSDDQIAVLKKELERLDMERFSLTLDKLGYFKGRSSYRVIYTNLDGDIQRLKQLVSNIEDITEQIGFSREKRRYVPHITVAQDVKLDCDFDVLQERVDTGGVIKVDRFSLIKSEQIGRKRVYTPIYTKSLI